MKPIRTLVVAALPLIALAFVFPAPAQAQVSVPMVVEATVLNTCVVAALPMAFIYDPASPTANQSTSTITVTSCFDPYELAIDQCLFGTGTADRKMDLLGTTLDYSLSCATENDLECASNWGDNNGVDTLTGAPGVLATYTVDGEIPASQGVPSGVYVDTCTVSFQF